MKQITIFLLISLWTVTSGAAPTAKKRRSRVKADADVVYLQKARKAYRQKRLDTAHQYYSRITPASDFWLEAVEEKAWIELRRQSPGKTLAYLKTIMSQTFRPQLGPEPYVLWGYTHLLTCNYPQALKSAQKFKKNFKPRVQNLKKLARLKQTRALKATLKHSARTKRFVPALGRQVDLLPRLFHRDRRLSRLFKRRKALYRSASSSQIQKKRNTIRVRKRIAQLARKDLREISQVIKRLKLIEVEATQRAFRATRVDEGQSIQTGQDTLSFVNDPEEWRDELGNYKFSASRCSETYKGAQL